MSKRLRQPSMKALEIAQDAYAISKALNTSKRREAYTEKAVRAEAALEPESGGREGLGTINPQVLTQTEATSASHDSEDVAYCVCRSERDEPMIECDHCQNWFHFSCVKLTQEGADAIDSYCCEACHQANLGSTKYIERAGSDGPKAGTDYSASPSSGSGDAESDVHAVGDSSDEEYDEGSKKRRPSGGVDEAVASPKKRRVPGTSARSARRVSFAVASSPPKTKKKKSRNSEAYAKTRLFCQRQFAEVLRDIFGASSSEAAVGAGTASAVDGYAGEGAPAAASEETTTSASEGTPATADAGDIPPRIDDYARRMEYELFRTFREPDADSILAPKTKYMSKSRSLLYNMKKSDVMRTRLLGGLEPEKAVHLTNEELLNPELRVMAEEIRAQSLKSSVKQAMEAPKAKITHKGEEAIEHFDAQDTFAQDESSLAEALRRRRESQADEAPDRSTALSAPSRPPRPTALDHMDILEEASHSPSHSPPSSRSQSPSLPPAGHSPLAHAPLSPLPSLFDEPLLDPVPADYVPQDAIGESSELQRDGYDEAFEDSLLQDEGTQTPRGPPPAAPLSDLIARVARAPQARVASLVDLDVVWTGDVLLPHEGGFPATAALVAGPAADVRASGPLPALLDAIVPRMMSIDGRLPTQSAGQYLLDCLVADSRDIVVLGILPDLAGPTDAQPHKPNAMACIQKYEHIYGFLAEKDRTGVIVPAHGDPVRRLVKDIYLMPLARSAPLPQFLAGVSDCALSEDERDQDLLLAVFVVHRAALKQRLELPEPGQDPAANFKSAAPFDPAASFEMPVYLPQPPYGGQSPTAHAAFEPRFNTPPQPFNGHSPVPYNPADRGAAYNPNQAKHNAPYNPNGSENHPPFPSHFAPAPAPAPPLGPNGAPIDVSHLLSDPNILAALSSHLPPSQAPPHPAPEPRGPWLPGWSNARRGNRGRGGFRGGGNNFRGGGGSFRGGRGSFRGRGH